MEADEVFIFYRSDLLSSYISAFEDMRGKEELIDFKITVQNRSFSGHRLILAAGVPYFRKLFANSVEEVFEEEIDADTLESVINFAYSGKIKITEANVRSLLSASKYLQLEKIHESCWEFLGKRLHLNNVTEIRTLAEKYNCSTFIDISDRYIRENFEEFSKSMSLLTLKFSYFKEIISRGDAKVSSEESVFEAVIRWVKDSPSERKHFLPELLGAVRLSHLTPEYLIDRVCSEELVRASSLCRDLVEEAKDHHLLRRSPFSRSKTPPQDCSPKTLQAGCADDNGHGTYAVCNSPSAICVKLLDPENSKWITLSTTHNHYPDFLTHVIAFRGKVYTFSWETIKTFDLKALTWETVEKVMRTTLSSFRIILHKNKIYFFGGDADRSDRVLCFNPLANEWLKEEKMAKGCRFPGVASLNGYVYITGGVCQEVIRKAVVRYEPETNEWTAMAPMLSSRSHHACASMNGKIYACGGKDVFESYVTAEVYDPLTNQWNSVSSMTLPRSDFSLVAHDGKLYAHETQLKDCGGAHMEIYDPENDEWTFGVAVPHESYCDVFLVRAIVPTESDEKDAKGS